MALFESKTESIQDSAISHKKLESNAFPRRERTPSGNIDPKGAFRFSPRLNRRNASHSFGILSVYNNNNSSNNNNNGNAASNKTTDISTMASSYSSAKLAPPISGATVEAFELRPDQQLWYVIQVVPCAITIPGSHPVLRKAYSIYRRYEDVADFAERLENEFPWLKSYQDGTQKNVLSFFREEGPAWSMSQPQARFTYSDADCSRRKQELSKYLQTLFTLGSIVSQCRLVSEFFGIWKTDLEFHLSKDDQDPLALHSLAPRPAHTSNTDSPSTPLNAIDHVEKRNSSVSTPPWSPKSVSMAPSACSSVTSSPRLAPSPGNKRSGFFWDIPSAVVEATLRGRRRSAPPREPSYHSSDSDDSDAQSDFSDATAASDTETLDKFPTPPFVIRKATSLNNLKNFSQGCQCQSPKPDHPRMSSLAALHKSLVSFEEDTLQSEYFAPLDYFSPRDTSLRGYSMGSEIRPRSSSQTTSISFNDCSDCSASPISIPRRPMGSRPFGTYISSSPLSASPPMTPQSRTLYGLMKGISDLRLQQPKGIVPLNPNPDSKPAMTSTAPLSPKMRACRTGSTIISHQSLIAEGLSLQSMSGNDVSSLLSSPLQSPVSPNFPDSAQSADCGKKSLRSLVSFSPNQKQPTGILKNKTMTGNNCDSNNQHHQPVTSPTPGSSFLAQHPQGFAATIKVVVNADTIIALQILEEEANFALSVPDLRLRVLNKFHRMSMAIPADFELVWSEWNGHQVVLKNDEELQRALMASPHNKITLRCIF
ncbi:hypothetical protein FBU30_010824 [Linnemannia zychae]|nr:hypothetical protein FBU30_010824 [Linnemannia zychae]